MASFFGLRQRLLSWLVLGGVTLLKAVSGSRFVYSACSNLMQEHYGISRVQLNNLIVASESGRLFGWFSNAAADYLPPPMILMIGLTLGLFGYGVQYLSITNQLSFLSYWHMLILNVIAGNSICWISTYCQLVTSKSFKNNCDTITAITSSYSGLSGKIYTTLVEGIQGRKGVKSQDSSIYLLLVCLAPIFMGLPVTLLDCLEVVGCDQETKMLPFLFVIAIATGVYAVVESIAQPFRDLSPKFRLINLVLVVMLPLVVAILMAANQLTLAKWNSNVMPEDSSTVTETKSKTRRVSNEGLEIGIEDEREQNEKAEMVVDGDENWWKVVVKSVDFWQFYWMNMCGATLGMVYLNNLERISELQGYHEASSSLLATSSTFSFFSRIFSAIFTWYTRENPGISKPALIMYMMLPMPVAFFLLIMITSSSSSSNISLYISTGIIGSSTGAINAIIESIPASELLSLSNSVVHQSILPTNIPTGTLIFGYLAAALNYPRDGLKTCIWGLNCNHLTFTIWGCASSIGTILSFSIYLRSRKNNLQSS